MAVMPEIRISTRESGIPNAHTRFRVGQARIFRSRDSLLFLLNQSSFSEHRADGSNAPRGRYCVTFCAGRGPRLR